MTTTRATTIGSASPANLARMAVGLIWLLGAAFNLLVTLRMPDAFGWLEESPVPLYRWFFRDVAGAHPAVWTVLLAGGEVALGVLTLARGGRAKLGLAGGALFSAFLVSLGSVYTLMMAPYALLLVYLSRKDYRRSLFDYLRRGFRQKGERISKHPV